MKKTTTIARIWRDGKIVEVLDNGSEKPFPDNTHVRKMTEEEIETAANSDPDAMPLTEKDFVRMTHTSRAKIIRRALRLTQEEFALRYCIPLGTLRDWEQGRSEPDQTASTYLKVIAAVPEAVQHALHT